MGIFEKTEWEPRA